MSNVGDFHFKDGNTTSRIGLNQTEAIDTVHKLLRSEDELRELAYIPPLVEGLPPTPHWVVRNIAGWIAGAVLLLVLYLRYRIRKLIGKIQRTNRELERRRQARSNSVYGRANSINLAVQPVSVQPAVEPAVQQASRQLAITEI